MPGLTIIRATNRLAVPLSSSAATWMLHTPWLPLRCENGVHAVWQARGFRPWRHDRRTGARFRLRRYGLR